MRIFAISADKVTELGTQALAQLQLPGAGYLWLSCSRSEFERQMAEMQATLQRLCALQLIDLHVSDLLNAQLPSRYDFTSQYDLLVFRRLLANNHDTGLPTDGHARARGGLSVLRDIDTSPVSFVVLDRLLLTVHPHDMTVRDSYAQRLLTAGGSGGAGTTASPDGRSTGARGVPTSPADLMLRLVNHMVDGFLALRRELTHQLDHWQVELLAPRSRFANWSTLLVARQSLHRLDEICEDQRGAIQDWMEALKSWPDTDTPFGPHERDMLQVRSRDVLEHIERVAHHVRQLEQNAETAVQIHFNAQSHRTNEIMRTLTVLTAVFLPLNLIAGIFGMNFEFIPLLHRSNGFWLAMASMALIAVGLVLFFWRKRYLERTAR